MTDMKKALAFIKNNASDVPATKSGTEWIIPAEIVDAIREQMADHNGSFAIDMLKFNSQFGWKPESSRGLFLQNKLNKQYPVDDGYEWHVGTIAKGTLYKFEIREVKEVEEE